MRGFRECWPGNVVAVKQLLIVVPTLFIVAACGSGKNQSSSMAAEANSLPPQAAAPQPATSQPSGVQVQVSPALTPSFDPSIHDYVINCTSSPEVQFTAWLPGGLTFGFFGPGEKARVPLTFPVGYFQKTLTLSAGQRFSFVAGAGTSEYSVRCLPQDFPPLSASIGGTREAEWYLFTPTIGAPSSYVIISDANGTPVWWKSESSGTAIDAKIVSKKLIAWTVQTVYGAGGQYVIRDFTGRVMNTITGNLDHHDLQETSTGTYLAIQDVARVCPPDCADMSPWGGSAQAAVVDAQIVELDKDSKVLWAWKTRDHVALSETGGTAWFPAVGNDIIHMNAVEPDGTDGVMFSARHLNAIYHITKSTGVVDWKIGGTLRPESLTVLGDTRPTSMGATGQLLSGQHDVRIWSDGTVSVHDNGTNINRPPFVIRYQIDAGARTAEVVEEIQDVRAPNSGCCGSARRLPGGHWLVAWGEQPFMTELDSSGSPVLTVQYNLGEGFSYRAIPIFPGTLSAVVLRDGMDAMAMN